jgi:hypothetical protein
MSTFVGSGQFHQPYQYGGGQPLSKDNFVSWGHPVSVGPAHGHVQPNTAGEYPSQNKWEPFFGMSPRPIIADPYDRENADLPDAYVGRNNFLSQVMITQITAGDAFWVTEVLPWQKTEDRDEITWDTLHFNDHMLNRRPEESVSRLLSFNRTEDRTNFVSYGIAMILESGFYKTAQGRMHYAMHLRQISNATIETACLGVALKLLNAKAPKDSMQERYDLGLQSGEFRRLLQREVDLFGIVQKTENGLLVAHDMLKQVLTQRGVMPNCTIVAQGVQKYLQQSRLENRYFLYNGSGKSGRSPDTSGFGSLHESRPFRIGEKRKNFDPFFQTRTIGNYFAMLAKRIADIPVQHYQSCLRDIFAWSETKNDWYRHSLRDVLLSSGIMKKVTARAGNEYNIDNDPGYGADERRRNRPNNHDQEMDGFRLTKVGIDMFAEHGDASWHDHLERYGYVKRVADAICGGPAHHTACYTSFKQQYIQRYYRPVAQDPAHLNQEFIACTDNMAQLFDLQDNTPAARVRLTGVTALPALEREVVCGVGGAAGTLWLPFLGQKLFLVKVSFQGQLAQPQLDEVRTLTQILVDVNTQSKAGTLAAASAGLLLRAQALDANRLGAVHKVLRLQTAIGLCVVGLNRAGAIVDAEQPDCFVTSLMKNGDRRLRNLCARLMRRQRELLLSIRTNGSLRVNVADPTGTLPAAADHIHGNANSGFHDRDSGVVSYANGPAANAAVNTALTAAHIARLQQLSSRTVLFQLLHISRQLVGAQKFKRQTIDGGVLHVEHYEDEREFNAQQLALMQRVQDALQQELQFLNSRDHLHRDIQRVAPRVLPQLLRRSIANHATPDAQIADTVKQFRLWFAACALCSRRDAFDVEDEKKEDPGATSRFADLALYVLLSTERVKVGNENEDCMSLHGVAWLSDQLHVAAAAAAPTLRDIVDQLQRDGAWMENVAQLAHELDAGLAEPLAQIVNHPPGAPRPDLAESHLDVTTETLRNNREDENQKRALVVFTLKSMELQRHAGFMLWCVENDVPLALSFLLFAPHMRFRCGSMVVAKAGSELGNTHYGWPDFQLARNANQKMIFGHFTMKLAPVVRNSANLVVGRDIYITDYEGGGGHEYWQYTTDDRARYLRGELAGRDLFVVAVPPNYEPKDDVMDICGEFDPRVFGGETHDGHYPTAPYYQQFWAWEHGVDSLHRSYEELDMPRFNTIVFQGAQVGFRSIGNGQGAWDEFTLNKGHLGERIYPGCGSVRTGSQMHLLPVNYTQTAALAIIT